MFHLMSLAGGSTQRNLELNDKSFGCIGCKHFLLPSKTYYLSNYVLHLEISKHSTLIFQTEKLGDETWFDCFAYTGSA